MNQQTDLIMKELKEGLQNKFNFVSDVILFIQRALQEGIVA
jgi:hypothetical protein